MLTSKRQLVILLVANNIKMFLSKSDESPLLSVSPYFPSDTLCVLENDIIEKYRVDHYPFHAIRCLKCHQNKVKVEGFCLNISYLALFKIFFMVL